MLQFAELRHNPVLLPKAGSSPIGFDELIFIAAQKTYQLDAQFASAQHVETVVWRCLADDAGKHRLLASLALLLPEGDQLRQHIEAFPEATEFRAKLKDVLGYLEHLSSPEDNDKLAKIQKALDKTAWQPEPLDDNPVGRDEEDEWDHLVGLNEDKCLPFLIRSNFNAAELAGVQELQDLLNELGVEDALRALQFGKEAYRA